MTVFYRGPCVQITQEVFEIRRPVCESFPIRELTSVHVVQREIEQPETPGNLWPSLASMVLAGAAVAVVAVAWQALDAEVVFGVLLVTTISSALAAGCWHTPEQPYELWASFRGYPICLFRTRDRRQLGQVCSALLLARGRNN